MLAGKTITTAVRFNNLNGIINVYKPSNVKVNQVRSTIITNLCRDLNRFPQRPNSQFVSIESTSESHSQFEVTIKENLSDHVLATGERYQLQDIKCGPATTLGLFSSGVLLLGINKGLKLTTKIHKARPIRVFHVTVCLGLATETNFPDSRTICKSTFRHVNQEKINSLLSSMQAAHQKKMFELCGVDLQSQAAYDLAIKGTIRPDSFKIPVIFGMKCILLNRPEFVLEIYSINETEEYFGTLVQEIGLQLKTVAHCTGIRCIRQGNFKVENSLLRRHWDFKSIMGNIEDNQLIIKENPQILYQTNSELVS